MRIIDAVNFIRENGVLKGWSNEQICVGIKNAIQDCCFAFELGPDGKLKAIAFGKWNSSTSVHITCFVGKGYVRAFLSYLKKVHPNVRLITSIHNGKPREYKLWN